MPDFRALWHAGNDPLRFRNGAMFALAAIQNRDFIGGKVLALCDVENGIVAEKRHCFLAGWLAQGVHCNHFQNTTGQARSPFLTCPPSSLAWLKLSQNGESYIMA